MFQIAPCVMWLFCWKLHENSFNRFPDNVELQYNLQHKKQADVVHAAAVEE